MNWSHDIFVILISFLLIVLGKKKLFFESGIDKTLGITFVVLSIVSMVYSLINITHNIELPISLRVGLMSIGSIIWLTLLFISANYFKIFKDKVLILVMIALFVYWIIAKDFIFSTSDSVLFLGFLFLLFSQFPRRKFSIK